MRTEMNNEAQGLNWYDLLRGANTMTEIEHATAGHYYAHAREVKADAFQAVKDWGEYDATALTATDAATDFATWEVDRDGRRVLVVDAEALREALEMCDDVTGNASGSYWCSAFAARACLERCSPYELDEIAEEIANEYECPEIYRYIHTEPERADVIIRCYLLGFTDLQELGDAYAAAALGDAYAVTPVRMED